MKKLIWILLAGMLLLAGCGQETPAETAETNETASAETEKLPMFTDAEEAKAKIRELCEISLMQDLLEPEGYNAFTALAEEGELLLAQENPDDAECCALAEELVNAYKAVEYLRGDVPRVYLNTYSPTPNYAEDSAVSYDGNPDDTTTALAVDGDSKTYWLSDETEAHCLTFDWGRIREIGYVVVEWGKGAAKNYEIDLSEDGENWTTVRVVEDGAKYKTQGLTLDTTVRARYMRMRMLTASSMPYQLEEIGAYLQKPEKAASIGTTYREAEVVIVDREGGKYPVISETVQVKVRGNSTANTVKNPYNIKFENKKTILGMKGTRKWCLLANLFDKTLIRNKLAYDFAAIAGVTPELKSTFVEVYLDGDYKGCYQLTMPVTDGTVDVEVEKGEMLLERNGYYNLEAAGSVFNYTPIAGIRFVPIAPEHGQETEEQKQAIKMLLKEAEFACISGDRERVEGILDIDSFVNMYICEELMKDIDIFHGSTYFYYKNEKLYSGPIWDMDLSMGNVSFEEGAADSKYAKYHNSIHGLEKYGNGKRNDSTTGNWATVDFYDPLMEARWFRDLVKERYTELIPAIETMYADGGMIDSYIEEFGDAFLRNYELGGYSLTTKYFFCEYDNPSADYMENVQYLKDWLRARDTWIRSDLGIE
ncbi:MAG: CotH kinase family protein [Clostridia bacterium]|nr:CotH kinase family protein [Clostridia bacterium]